MTFLLLLLTIILPQMELLYKTDPIRQDLIYFQQALSKCLGLNDSLSLPTISIYHWMITLMLYHKLKELRVHSCNDYIQHKLQTMMYALQIALYFSWPAIFKISCNSITSIPDLRSNWSSIPQNHSFSSELHSNRWCCIPWQSSF
jgi:hypothetical protein